jgi:putative Mg2+ transporter-C (MgtC) family protein
MPDALAQVLDLDWSLVVRHLVSIGVAYVLAMPLGWDRESRSRGAGLRTFPLVAAGSCGFLMLGQVVLQGSESHARLMYGLMTGIGFIGGGSILKDGGSVTGTATAASIWNTGALGAAVAWQRYEIAVVLSLINFLTLRYVRSLKPLVRGSGAD